MLEVKRFCDRCEKQIDKEYCNIYLTPYGKRNEMVLSQDFDLCSDCTKIIDKFIKNK